MTFPENVKKLFPVFFVFAYVPSGFTKNMMTKLEMAFIKFLIKVCEKIKPVLKAKLAGGFNETP